MTTKAQKKEARKKRKLTIKPVHFMLWLTGLTLIMAGIGFSQISLQKEQKELKGRETNVETLTDPCSDDLHGKVCQLRTCTRLDDIGLLDALRVLADQLSEKDPTQQCITLFALRDKGELGGGIGDLSDETKVKGGDAQSSPKTGSQLPEGTSPPSQ